MSWQKSWNCCFVGSYHVVYLNAYKYRGSKYWYVALGAFRFPSKKIIIISENVGTTLFHELHAACITVCDK